jgi:putative transcriptional regulator
MALLLAERKKQGLSHQALADAAGLHRSTISLIETGKRVPTILVCLKLAMALKINLESLLKEASQ